MTPELRTANWRVSSYSGSNGGNCVEVAFDAPLVGLRDSKDRDAGSLVVSGAAWTRFLDSLHRSEP